MRYLSSYSDRDPSDMTDLDPERFTLRQAAQARDDFAQVMAADKGFEERIAVLLMARQ